MSDCKMCRENESICSLCLTAQLRAEVAALTDKLELRNAYWLDLVTKWTVDEAYQRNRAEAAETLAAELRGQVDKLCDALRALLQEHDRTAKHDGQCANAFVAITRLEEVACSRALGAPSEET